MKTTTAFFLNTRLLCTIQLHVRIDEAAQKWEKMRKLKILTWASFHTPGGPPIRWVGPQVQYSSSIHSCWSPNGQPPAAWSCTNLWRHRTMLFLVSCARHVTLDHTQHHRLHYYRHCMLQMCHNSFSFLCLINSTIVMVSFYFWSKIILFPTLSFQKAVDILS